MKLLSIFWSFSFIFICLSSYAQQQERKMRPTKVETKEVFNPQNNDYLIKTEKVKKLFVSGVIPSDFPKASSFSSKKEYKRAAISYASRNAELFNLELLKKHGVVLNPSPTKLTEQEFREQKLTYPVKAK